MTMAPQGTLVTDEDATVVKSPTDVDPRVKFGGEGEPAGCTSNSRLKAPHKPTTKRFPSFKSKSPGRATTALFDQVRDIDSEQGAVTADTLFANLDRDRDGIITKVEFRKMFEVVKAQVAKDHMLLTRSNRQKKMLLIGSSVLLLVVLILLGSIAALLYSMLEATKEMHATQIAGSSGALLSTI